MQGKGMATWRILGLGLIVIVALIIIFSSYTIIQPGHRGVVVMLGRVEDTELGEGFHLILPPVARQVVPIDVRTKKFEVDVEAASADLQLIQVIGVLNCIGRWGPTMRPLSSARRCKKPSRPPRPSSASNVSWWSALL
jgi:hypothetical protein